MTTITMPKKEYDKLKELEKELNDGQYGILKERISRLEFEKNSILNSLIKADREIKELTIKSGKKKIWF